MARLGKINLVQVAEPQPFPVQLNDRRFGAAFEQLCFDLRFCIQHAADDLGGTNEGRSRNSRGYFVFELAIQGPRILAKCEENWVTQGVLVCPSAELDARDQCGSAPGR